MENIVFNVRNMVRFSPHVKNHQSLYNFSNLYSLTWLLSFTFSCVSVSHSLEFEFSATALNVIQSISSCIYIYMNVCTYMCLLSFALVPKHMETQARTWHMFSLFVSKKVSWDSSFIPSRRIICACLCR